MAKKIYNSDGNANFDNMFEDTQFTVDLGLKRFVNNSDAKGECGTLFVVVVYNS